MSLMDKIRSFFSGGDDSHAGHDHSQDGHEHPPEPNAPTVPTDPVVTPASEGDEDATS
jgi:hypothetical protein